MLKGSKKFTKLAVAGALALTLSPLANHTVSADTLHPHPYYKDTWNFGVNDNYGYSNYYVKSPNNIGSKSSITNLWGTVKSSDSQKYGWAMSSSTKSWNDVRLNAHWNYFKF